MAVAAATLDAQADPTPRAFAGARALARAELLAAPVRWPRPSRLAEPLQAPTRKAAAGLRALGLETVGDLLEHLPSDSRQGRTVAALQAGEQATVAVEVRAIRARPVRRRGMRPLVEATVFDASATMRATFFNQPWLAERYSPGTRLLLHGKADGRGGFRVSTHALAPDGARASDARAEVAISHYPASEGVSSTQILTLVQGCAEALGDVVEPLPGMLRAAERLPERAAAMTALHFPASAAQAEDGRRRLAFEELLLGQLALLGRRAARARARDAVVLASEPASSARWLREALPFAHTGDQLRAIAQIDADIAGSRPMQRLLMGDVGSGKTVVALYAMLRAFEQGHQAALMAPTETLAEQHFATLQRLLGAEPVAAALLTGSTPAARRRDALGKLASGELALVVGTHALIEPDVRFASLAVAIVDEQHRFGVRQRAALEDKNPAGAVHVLHMTATPIPRTLALARYGDLDTSTLRELPAGRRPIATRLLDGERERREAYAQVRAELDRGRQAYVVCPLIEDGEGEGVQAEGELRAAKAELVRLREGELRGYEVALLHGGMRPREKQRAMAAFAAGEAHVLVATTVVEVGIDVPNATVMLVENAERFGISQLHQLRGRVGRGEHGGLCLLVAGAGSDGSARLQALARHRDGFRLAEIDLRLRREGELAGTRQSGASAFRVARLPEDEDLLERARVHAESIVAGDPQLRSPEHALLALALPAAAAPIPG